MNAHTTTARTATTVAADTIAEGRDSVRTTPETAATCAGASNPGRVVRSDRECQAEATEFVVRLIGSTIADLRWDDTHHLRGHGSFHGLDLVVIAPRDDRHQTVVLTADDWNVVRVADADQRCNLLNAYSLGDRARLTAVISTS